MTDNKSEHSVRNSGHEPWRIGSSGWLGWAARSGMTSKSRELLGGAESQRSPSQPNDSVSDLFTTNLAMPMRKSHHISAQIVSLFAKERKNRSRSKRMVSSFLSGLRNEDAICLTSCFVAA